MSEFDYEAPVNANVSTTGAQESYDWAVQEQDFSDWLSDLAEQGF